MDAGPVGATDVDPVGGRLRLRPGGGEESGDDREGGKERSVHLLTRNFTLPAQLHRAP